MTRQLTLLTSRPGARPVRSRPARRTVWRLDERTREVGRQGVAEARAALAAARTSPPPRRDGPAGRSAA